MGSLLFYEAINCLLASLGVFVIVMFCQFLTARVIEQRRRGGTCAVLRNDIPVQAAIAVVVMMSGTVGKDAWFWFGRYLENTGRATDWMLAPGWLVVPAACVLVAIVGKLCMIRVFAPPGWGRFAWVTCGIAAAAVTVSVALLR
jgi:hypothetical protein